MFLNQTASGGRAVAPVPTHTPVRTHRVQGEAPSVPAAQPGSSPSLSRGVPKEHTERYFQAALRDGTF